MPEEKETHRSRVIAQEIRDWIESISGTFHIRDLYQWIPELAKNTPDKRKISAYLSKMVKAGLLEKNGRYGIYRKVDQDLELMDFLGADDSAIDIWLPFGLTDYVEIMPGNIIAIAGEKETGKTTIAMNIAWANRDQFKVYYFNSEMGRGELKKRILKFKNTDPYEWASKINFYQKMNNFQDFVKGDAGTLNIIDFMEATCGDDYVNIAGWIMQIHKRIIDNGGICIICLEKPPGRDEGIGGRGTLDKPRLYLAVSRGRMKIVTAKNWASDKNPRDMTIDFKIVQGSELIPVTDWTKTDKWSL